MSIKIYKHNDNTQISEHFNVQEFKCKCGEAHDIKIDTDLVDKLEILHKTLNCKAIYINSGYRCSAHDKTVGGNGNGQHTKGTAVDIVADDKNGKRISAKVLTAVAQDIGFSGIANINDYLTAVHLDTRTSGNWYGDERKGTGMVTSDFYDYWGISKSDIYSSESKSIDVSIVVDGVTYSGTLKSK